MLSTFQRTCKFFSDKLEFASDKITHFYLIHFDFVINWVNLFILYTSAKLAKIYLPIYQKISFLTVEDFN